MIYIADICTYVYCDSVPRIMYTPTLYIVYFIYHNMYFIFKMNNIEKRYNYNYDRDENKLENIYLLIFYAEQISISQLYPNLNMFILSGLTLIIRLIFSKLC